MQQQEPPILDLEAIEAALVLIPIFPAYFYDMRALVAEVKRLRAIVGEQTAKIAELEMLVDHFQNWCAAPCECEMPPCQLVEVEMEIEGVPV